MAYKVTFGYDRINSLTGERINPGDDLRIVLPGGIDPKDVIALGKAAGASRIDTSDRAIGVVVSLFELIGL